MTTMHAVSLVNHFRAVADTFISTTEQLRGEPHKSEVLLIANTLLVVKAKNIYRNIIKMHKTMYVYVYIYIYNIYNI